MKKIMFTLILSTIYFGILSAQTNQGNILTGVSTTFNLAGTGSDLVTLTSSRIKYKSDAAGFEETAPNKMTGINLMPRIGYFIVDNLAVGLDLNVALSSTKDGEDTDKYSQTLLSVGPFVRYYIPATKALPFFELGGSFGTIKNKYENSNSTNGDGEEYKSSGVSFGGGIGLAAPLGDKVMFDIVAGYNSLTVKDKDNNEDNSRTIISTLGLRLGFTIFLGGS